MASESPSSEHLLGVWLPDLLEEMGEGGARGVARPVATPVRDETCMKHTPSLREHETHHH